MSELRMTDRRLLDRSGGLQARLVAGGLQGVRLMMNVASLCWSASQQSLRSRRSWPVV